MLMPGWRQITIVVGVALLLLLQVTPPRTAALAVLTWKDVLALQRTFDKDGVSVTASARAVVGDARAWQSESAPLVRAAPAFAWLPLLGGDLGQAAQLAKFLDATLDAVEPSLALYELLIVRLGQDDSFGAALIEFAKENETEIFKARASLASAIEARAKIDEHSLSPAAQRILRDADRALLEWDAALRLVMQAPELFGDASPRYYLVLAQNNDEIRATGGFISAVGVLKVERGEIGVEWFGDSFAADDLTLIHPKPPLPLQKYMWASQWLLRDSNWDADFPTSARRAQTMWAFDRHLRTDGVIAVDTRFLPRLVGAMGDVKLDGQPLAQENVIQMLKESWQPMPPGDMSAAWFENDRKSFLADLMNGLLERFRAGDAQANALATALWRGLREKSVQIYLENADAEKALVDAGWGGAVIPGEHDYLFVVDSNVGFNKVNARVKRAIAYSVRLDKNGGEATVEITYDNPSRGAEGGCDLLKQHKNDTYASMEQSCYWNYVRVLAPHGSRFVAAEGVSEGGVTEDKENVTEFGGYVVVPRNTRETVRFRYTVPTSVMEGGMYALKVQQQAGADGTPVTVRVELPPGLWVRDTSHTVTRREGQVLEFHETLYQDMTFKIFFEIEGKQ